MKCRTEIHPTPPRLLYEVRWGGVQFLGKKNTIKYQTKTVNKFQDETAQNKRILFNLEYQFSLEKIEVRFL
jgi:hypothetical protein